MLCYVALNCYLLWLCIGLFAIKKLATYVGAEMIESADNTVPTEETAQEYEKKHLANKPLEAPWSPFLELERAKQFDSPVTQI